MLNVLHSYHFIISRSDEVVHVSKETTQKWPMPDQYNGRFDGDAIRYRTRNIHMVRLILHKFVKQYLCNINRNEQSTQHPFHLPSTYTYHLRTPRALRTARCWNRILTNFFQSLLEVANTPLESTTRPSNLPRAQRSNVNVYLK